MIVPRAPITIGTILPLLHCTCSNPSSSSNFSYLLILSCLLCSKYWLLVSYGIVTSIMVVTSSFSTMVMSGRSSSVPVLHDLSLQVLVCWVLVVTHQFFDNLFNIIVVPIWLFHPCFDHMRLGCVHHLQFYFAYISYISSCSCHYILLCYLLL